MTTLMILVVEDDVEFSNVLSFHLSRLPLSLAISVERTLAGAKHYLTTTIPDLVFLDLHLPDGEGMSLLDSLCGVPAVILTADSTEPPMWEAVYAGAVDYLVKQTLTSPLLLKTILFACGLLDRPGCGKKSRAVAR